MRKVELLLVVLILTSMIGNLIWLGYFSSLFLISGTLLSILYFAMGFALFTPKKTIYYQP